MIVAMFLQTEIANIQFRLHAAKKLKNDFDDTKFQSNSNDSLVTHRLCKIK